MRPRGGARNHWRRRGAVSEVIKRRRDGKSVEGTQAHELQHAFHHFGYEMTLLADL